MDYQCKACGAEAKIEAGEVVRSCSCNTTVVANMKAHATGVGSMGETPAMRLLSLFRSIGRLVLDDR